jgi:putative membrane protein
MRTALAVAGVAVLTCVWLAPLDRLAPGPFSAHMAVHMAVVAVAAPLLALGVAGSRLDPFRKFPRLAAPIPLSVLELAVVWVWHTPALHHAAHHSGAWFAVEQGMFLLSGLFLWLSLFGGEARITRNRCGAGVVALLLTSMHMTLLGALVALAQRPLYGRVHATARGPALSALDDQQLGGAIMIVAGGVAYILGGLWLSARLLRDGGAKAEANS